MSSLRACVIYSAAFITNSHLQHGILLNMQQYHVLINKISTWFETLILKQQSKFVSLVNILHLVGCQIGVQITKHWRLAKPNSMYIF